MSRKRAILVKTNKKTHAGSFHKGLRVVISVKKKEEKTRGKQH